MKITKDEERKEGRFLKVKKIVYSSVVSNGQVRHIEQC